MVVQILSGMGCRCHRYVPAGLIILVMCFHGIFRSTLLTLSVAGAAVANPISAPAQEYQLKSAFIYNFATFIDWPDKMGKSLTLCVAASPAVMEYFAPLNGKPVGNMTVAVRHLDEEASADGCHILFVTETKSGALDGRLSDVGDEPVLTMAESEEWLEKGVIIDLQLQNGKIIFDVNVAAAKQAGVVINSNLLRLARKVYGLELTDKPVEKSAEMSATVKSAHKNAK